MSTWVVRPLVVRAKALPVVWSSTFAPSLRSQHACAAWVIAAASSSAASTAGDRKPPMGPAAAAAASAASRATRASAARAERLLPSTAVGRPALPPAVGLLAEPTATTDPSFDAFCRTTLGLTGALAAETAQSPVLSPSWEGTMLRWLGWWWLLVSTRTVCGISLYGPQPLALRLRTRKRYCPPATTGDTVR